MSVVEESIWYECPLDVALEKCRQALRQHCKKKLNAATDSKKLLLQSDDVPTLHQNEEKLANASRLGTLDVEGPLSGIDSNWNLEEEAFACRSNGFGLLLDDAGPSAGVMSPRESMTIPPSTNLIASFTAGTE